MGGKVKAALTVALLAVSSIPACAAWTCSAPGLITGQYDGGDSAYIHLTGFRTGNNYPVAKKGNRATGTTKNGTHFVCTQN
ncbi:hypothetical protein [Bradyrhizobium mercantei]|uniref:hypothetical protein n=1 Tax=Bradyrhizobium mercantei TaxID=1904807 RepID=UPI000975E974|nr:hypothetical protein [Bradyrhizobium mercantei]